MKMNVKILGVCLLTAGMLAISCSDDSDEVTTDTQDAVSTENLILAAQVDNIDDASYTIIDNAYLENVNDTRNTQADSFFADCATITVSPNGDGSGSIIVDFGEICQLINGALVSGQVLLDYDIEQGESRNMTYTYQDFTYNGKEISGGGTVNRVFENGNGNPQSVITSNIAVYFPLAEVSATRAINRTREWIEGVGSGTWTDNVFSVTGNWNTEFSSGFTRSGTVTEALRREATCLHFVDGVVDITQNGNQGSLDFGDGTCDNVAVVIINGEEYTIQL